ncbi:MAG: processed acidic surface protein [Bacilli bacterium]|nr:processed acidic surface protein [Bacilli bacterium]
MNFMLFIQNATNSLALFFMDDVIQDSLDCTDFSFRYCFSLPIINSIKVSWNIISIESDLNSPEVGERLESIAERMMSMDPENPTEEQIKDVGIAFEELLSIFQMTANFYIIDGNTTTPISIADLMQMEVLDGDYLLIQLFDLNGELLADMKVTSDDIKEVPTIVDEVTDTVKEVVEVPKINHKPKTLKGGKLPTTDSNNLDGALAGTALIGAGLFLYRRVRTS